MKKKLNRFIFNVRIVNIFLRAVLLFIFLLHPRIPFLIKAVSMGLLIVVILIAVGFGLLQKKVQLYRYRLFEQGMPIWALKSIDFLLVALVFGIVAALTVFILLQMSQLGF